MSMFVEVYDAENHVPAIINLDSVIAILPIRVEPAPGGCRIYFDHALNPAGQSYMSVREPFSKFQQFVMQTVSSDDIANRFPKDTIIKEPISLPQLKFPDDNNQGKATKPVTKPNKSGTSGAKVPQGNSTGNITGQAEIPAETQE